MADFTGPRIFITAPRTIEFRDHTIRQSDLKANVIVVKTRYTQISPGTEGAIYTGENKRVHDPGAWCAYPFNSGYANIGEVVWKGADVAGIELGSFVFTQNQHGSYYTADPSAEAVIPLPDGLVQPPALVTRLAGTAMSAPLLSSRTLGVTVVVFGLGIVGNLAAQLYTLGGATVVGVDPNEARRGIATDVGIAAASGPEPDSIRAALESVGLPEKVDVVVDAVGLTDLDIESVERVRRHGEFILLGSPKKESTKGSLSFFRYAHLNNVRVIGALESGFPVHAPVGSHSLARAFELAVRLIADGRLKAEPLISHVLPFEEAQTGYDGLIDRQSEYISVALDWA